MKLRESDINDESKLGVLELITRCEKRGWGCTTRNRKGKLYATIQTNGEYKIAADFQDLFPLIRQTSSSIGKDDANLTFRLNPEFTEPKPWKELKRLEEKRKSIAQKEKKVATERRTVEGEIAQARRDIVFQEGLLREGSWSMILGNTWDEPYTERIFRFSAKSDDFPKLISLMNDDGLYLQITLKEEEERRLVWLTTDEEYITLCFAEVPGLISEFFQEHGLDVNASAVEGEIEWYESMAGSLRDTLDDTLGGEDVIGKEEAEDLTFPDWEVRTDERDDGLFP